MSKTDYAPKRKTNKKRTKKRDFFSFVASPVVRRVTLVIVIVVLLYLFGARAWQNAVTLFGAGLFLLAGALGVIIWAVWKGRSSALAKHWNWCVGGTILALALWGIFSFFRPGAGILQQVTLGGRFGNAVIGAPDVTGALRVAGLSFLGVVFIAPHSCWHAVKRAFSGSSRFLSRAARPSRKVGPERVSSEAIALKPGHETAEGLPYAARVGKEAQEKEVTGVIQHQPILTPSGWKLPPIDLLNKPTEVELNEDDIDKRAQLIEEALASYGVDAKVVQINIGPTVTQFGVEPGWDRKYKEIRERGKDGSVETHLEEVSKTRVKVDRITSLANDLALALAVPSIRIEAPVPGKPMVGIEVPNTVFGSVSLRSVIETAAFQRIKSKSKLAIALGKGAGGEAIAADLARMPHLLIAGATGSGKTVCLNSIICCLLLHNSPDDVRFIMVDPKRVELVNFNGVPHLAAEVVVDSDKAVKALRWLTQEMDNRYRRFAQAGARNIEGYNKECSPENRLPYLVLIIDELADLMMTAFDEVEHALCRLAQLARATGIHLVVATQRPSVDVVTGLIKANFPTRISFAVSSQVDSRTILDMAGAEKLLGRGDMLYMPTEAAKPKRLQGTFVSDAEIDRLVYFWASQRRLAPSSINFDEIPEPVSSRQAISPVPDPLLEEARHLAQEHKDISPSFLQRHLRIGYPRAARLMEALKQEGLAGTAEPRQEN